MQLLSAGPALLSLYTDASFADELGVGAWVYSVPAFSVLQSGIEPGHSANGLELAAVVHGLAAVCRADRTARDIHVYTDSEFVIGLMAHVSQRQRMPLRKSYKPMADLYARASDVAATRTLKIFRRADRDPYHAECDRRAREELRRHCTKGELARKITLKRVHTRRDSILQEIRKAQRSLRKLEQKLLQCDVEIAALTYRTVNENSRSDGPLSL